VTAVRMQVEMIQSGWKVVGSDGNDLGTVGTIDEHTLVVRKHGLLGDREMHLPRHTVADVEEGRVELNVSKRDVERLFA
jgi:hypothetical protein